MALINRMSRLLSADLHAVLDRIEEPAALLRQAIREMEEELAREEHDLRQLEHERAALQDRRSALEASLAELDRQLDVCFDAGNDALARKLVRRKLEAERLDAQFAARLEAVGKAHVAASSAFRERSEQLDVMRQRAELFVEREAPERTFHDEASAGRFTIGDDEVEIAYLQERQRRAQR